MLCQRSAVLDEATRATASDRAAAVSNLGVDARLEPIDRNRVPVRRGVSSELRSDAFSTGWAPPGLGVSASAVCARYASPTSSSREPTKRSWVVVTARDATGRARFLALVEPSSDARGRFTPRGVASGINAGGGGIVSRGGGGTTNVADVTAREVGGAARLDGGATGAAGVKAGEAGGAVIRSGVTARTASLRGGAVAAGVLAGEGGMSSLGAGNTLPVAGVTVWAAFWRRGCAGVDADRAAGVAAPPCDIFQKGLSTRYNAGAELVFHIKRGCLGHANVK